MKSRAIAWFLCFAIAGFCTAGAQEKETSKQAVEKRLRDVQKEKSSLAVEKAIEALAAASSFGQVAISPDGKKVAWVEELRDKNGAETGNSAILAATMDGKAPPRKISASSGQPRAESDIAWAPDSRRLAYLSDRDEAGIMQLCLLDLGSRHEIRVAIDRLWMPTPMRA